MKPWLFASLSIIIQVILAAIIQHYDEHWFFLFCFTSLLANLYYLCHGLVQGFCILNDEIVLRFLASELKSGITEDDLKAAYEKRLALVGLEEAERIERRRWRYKTKP